jgi:hypothetical protein
MSEFRHRCPWLIKKSRAIWPFSLLPEEVLKGIYMMLLPNVKIGLPLLFQRINISPGLDRRYPNLSPRYLKGFDKTHVFNFHKEFNRIAPLHDIRKQ